MSVGQIVHDSIQRLLTVAGNRNISTVQWFADTDQVIASIENEDDCPDDVEVYHPKVPRRQLIDYWSPAYKGAILSDLAAAIEMLERVRNWYDARGNRYVIKDDVDALLARLRR